MLKMPLDPVSAKKVTDWLTQKAPYFGCSVCGQRKWNADDLLAGLVMPEGGHLNVANAQIAPFVPVVCTHCGHTVLFSAVLLGLAPKGSP
jgi:hypothetical protein